MMFETFGEDCVDPGGDATAVPCDDGLTCTTGTCQ